MANTRLFRSSQNLAIGATIKNGTGGGAPALQEATGYPMSNALQHDRYSPWQAAPTGTPLNFDFSLASSSAVYAIGLHRHILRSGSFGTLTIQYQTGTYTPGGAWSTFGTISAASQNAAKDCVSIDTATQTMQHVRLSFSHTTATWTTGKFFVVAAPTIDTGVIYKPGGIETAVRYQNQTATPGGYPVVDDFGEDGKLWEIELDVVATAIKTAVITAVNSGRSCSLLDENDALSEVVFQGGAIPVQRMFTSSWNPRLFMSKLP